MPISMSPEEIEHLARRRAGAKLGWFFHLAVFLVVNLMFFAMSHHGWGNRPWSPFPLLGWGMGLLMHGIAVFVLGSGLRERMIQHERKRLQRLYGLDKPQ